MDVSRLDPLRGWLRGGVDLVLVDPPFGGTDRPSLALHLLQAIAREEGVAVKVLYANLILARDLGEATYERLCYASSGALLGERFFAKVAYGKTPSMNGTRGSATHIRTSRIDDDLQSLSLVYGKGDLAREWCAQVAELIVESEAAAVGFTTTFEQTAATVALAHAVNEVRADIELLVGGANSEGEMAEGVSVLAPFFDFIFSGESEETFRLWCRDFASRRGSVRVRCETTPIIVNGKPCHDLDSLPRPDYEDYYDQLEQALPNSELLRTGSVWLPYETSRGCWWGQKHHCTFCGINGDGMAFRQKSPSVVVRDLDALIKDHPTNRVMMVDNIMPHSYFSDLLPMLSDRREKLHIFYEQKANLDFRRVRRLKKAGVEVIQPGIEALDSALLHHMRKGVRARQNIALLRYALMNDVFVNWNLLHSFPGDRIHWYESTLRLLPFLTHLCPPTGVFGLSIDRFSPYFDKSESFGIRAITPVASYFDVLPEGVPVEKIAYHFEASYASESRSDPSVIKALETAVASWRAFWEAGDGLPLCHVIGLDDDYYLLIDTRPEVGCGYKIIDRAKARIVLTGPGGSEVEDILERRAFEWALDHNLCVWLDDTAVPLATTSAELYVSFEPQASRPLRAPAQ